MCNLKFKYIAKREDLTQGELLAMFHYDPLTGDFKRLVKFDSYGGYKKCDKILNAMNNKGYRWVRIFGQTFLIHRLIWLYQTGQHPTNEIDHIDGDRLNNRWSNLRDITPFDNARNQGNRSDNTSGVRGVNYQRGGRGAKRWIARISHKGVRYCLGYFHTLEEAAAARKQAEIDFRYHPNHAKRDSWKP